MNVLTPTLGLGVGYSERYAQQSKCSNVRTKTLAARDARPRFHLRPALKLPEQHFHFSAVVCILIIHLQPASRSPTGRQLSLAFSRFICSGASCPPAIPFLLFCSQHCHEPCLGGHGCILHAAAGLPEEALWSNASAQFICTLQLWCPRRSCGRMHPHSSSALCSRAAQGGSVVYLWSNASAEFICTMQPLRPSKDEAQACRYGVQLHSAALLPERLGQG